ncbi:MAG: hypothetical protein LBD95_03905 [Clostridiales Family XIII bacterium]|jgi:hypothetical protein|nr:hypothetical protein [Clostridiales Family XIII bacterium]
MRKTLLLPFLSLALLSLSTGCGADAASPEGAYKAWDELVLSDEALERLEAERELRANERSEAEKQDEILAWYAQSLAAAREEERVLSERLEEIRAIAALPELPEEPRAKYAALVAETEAAIRACAERRDRLEADTARIEALREPPPDWVPPDD